jgi:polar amino acid transport system substrate-binding protein
LYPFNNKTQRRAGKTKRLAIIAMSAVLILIGHHPSSSQTLKVAVDVWHPYEDISDQHAPGFSTEVFTHVFQSMGVEMSLKEYPWARGLKNVYEGISDALFTAFPSEERRVYCYYPDEPLAIEKWILFIRSEDRDKFQFSSYDDLIDKSIGVLRGASVSEEFWAFVKRHNNYQEVTVDELNFEKLMLRRIDCIVTSHSNGMVLVKKKGLKGKVVPLLTRIIKEDNLYIIFSKKTVTPDFVKEFSRELRDFKKNEEYRLIYEKYFK